MTDKLNLFHTPLDWNELIDWINRHPKDDRPPLITAAGQGYNLAISLNQKEEDK